MNGERLWNGQIHPIMLKHYIPEQNDWRVWPRCSTTSDRGAMKKEIAYVRARKMMKSSKADEASRQTQDDIRAGRGVGDR